MVDIIEASKRKIEKLFDDKYENIIISLTTIVDDRLIDNNVTNSECEITGLDIVGSRRFGNPRPNSDLDIILTYTGSIKEDSLFNILNDPKSYIYSATFRKITLDFNPIKNGDINYEVEKRSTYKK